MSLPFPLQFFAESIFHLVREKHTELAFGGFSASRARHKVLAGVVMTRGKGRRHSRSGMRAEPMPRLKVATPSSSGSMNYSEKSKKKRLPMLKKENYMSTLYSSNRTCLLS